MSNFLRLCLTVAVLSCLAPPALARPTGISGYSGQTQSCTSCHAPSGATATVTLTGPTTLSTSQAGTYTVTLSGGPAVEGGLDVSATGGGVLSVISGQTTKLLNSEVTHSSAKPFSGSSGSSVSWQFTMTAPSSAGSVKLYCASLSGNGNGSSGDATATTTLSVVVTGGNLCAGVVCTASDQCHDAGTCDSTSGKCSNPAKANGTACNDANACTSGETCQSGVCGSPTSTVTCTASDQCHVAGTCDPASGKCSDPAASDGLVCDDGKACTSGDRCLAGVCTPTANNCACTSDQDCKPLDQCHLKGTCNGATGVCTNPLVQAGTLCDDADKCTQGESCTAGVCGSPTSTTLCQASDACHLAGTCDPATGSCSNPDAPDGTACNGGSCESGACVLPLDASVVAGPDAASGDAERVAGPDASSGLDAATEQPDVAFVPADASPQAADASAQARDATAAEDAGAVAPADSGTDDSSAIDSGCSCSSTSTTGISALALAALLSFWAPRRRRAVSPIPGRPADRAR